MDPNTICNGGSPRRRLKPYSDIYTGDRLLIQMGNSPLELLNIPMNTKEMDRYYSSFYEAYCVPGMGHHYTSFSYQLDQDCYSVMPLQILYDRDELIGFVWMHYAMLSNKQFERPPSRVFRNAFKVVPDCLYKIAESQGFRTMHHYFIENPLDIQCPREQISPFRASS